MSDMFDPDAWPHSGSGPVSKPGNGRDTARRVDEDDDYDTIPLDGPPPPPRSRFDEYQDDYGAGGYDDDLGEYDASPKTSRNDAVGSARHDDYDDDYDAGYDDYDDDYGDFDREPAQKGGRGKLIGAAAVVVLLVAIGAFALNGGGGEDNPTETTRPQNSTQTTGNVEPGATGTVAEAPKEVTTAMNKALDSWGEFAVEGNLDTVRPYFVNDGPQFDRFQAEEPAIKANPPGGAPLEMKMENSQAIKVDDDNWLIKGTVTVTRPNETAQNFPWELRIVRQSDNEPWQVLSVRQY